MRLLSALLFGFCFLIGSQGAAAEEEQTPAQELQSHIDQINGQIEEKDTAMAALDAKVSDLSAQIKTLKTDSDKLKLEERDLSQQLARLATSREELEVEVKSLDAQAQTRRELSIRRLRAGYMHPTEQALSDLIQDSRSDSFSHLGFYLAAVHSYDRRMIDELLELSRSRAEKREELKVVTVNQQKVVQDLKVRRDSISKKMSAQEPLIKQLKTQHAEQEVVVTQLKAQLLRFETVLAGLTGGTSDRHITSHHASSTTVSEGDSAPFEGKGLAALKGKLPLPVEGKVIVPFGKVVSARNGIAGSSKGIELAVSVGASVKAVAAGKVIFFGRMPILGTIVILDHGDRYYSLYGRLGSSGVAVGAVVQQGDELAKVSTPEPDGRNLYFEIRKNGNPVNPAPFLSSKL